jgi:tripartite-type tricarboxylate transporter receptor subunit TctC
MNKLLFSLLCLLLWSANAHAQTPFYQGKTIRVIVGTPPGNLYDLWARLIVAHMGKHIPGNPEFIVQNMPGAGHVVAANHLYSMAKPDGLTLIGSIFYHPFSIPQPAHREIGNPVRLGQIYLDRFAGNRRFAVVYACRQSV